jgi:DNA-binding transcriptional regulator YiaG
MTVTAVACPHETPGRRASREWREWVTAATPGAVRVGCGLTLATLGEALGVHLSAVQRWENGLQRPAGESCAAYRRVIAGLARHLEATP